MWPFVLHLNGQIINGKPVILQFVLKHVRAIAISVFMPSTTAMINVLARLSKQDGVKSIAICSRNHARTQVTVYVMNAGVVSLF